MKNQKAQNLKIDMCMKPAVSPLKKTCKFVQKRICIKPIHIS